MSLALVHSRARAGVHAPLVQVEVHLSGGLPFTQIVGLPEAAVRESRDRVRAAILCAQFDYPARRITINLAPADLPKEGGYRLDVAIDVVQFMDESMDMSRFLLPSHFTIDHQMQDEGVPTTFADRKVAARSKARHGTT